MEAISRHFRCQGVIALVAVLFFSTAHHVPAQSLKPLSDGAKRLQAFQQYLEMKEASSLKDLKWQFAGPTNISIRCTDVEVVAPKGKNYTMYAATASGGVWKTTNEGTTWEPVFENFATASIGDIALDPSDPEILWVGTGEANIFRSSQAGAGIYRTTDGGKSWEHLGLENTLTIARIIVHPENSEVVYLAASGHEWTPNRERGVYKTTNGGKSWEKILYIDELTGAIDLVMHPVNPDILYAATWQRVRKKWNDPRTEEGYSGSGVWKTTDGGKKWEQANNGLPAPAYRGRIGIDIARSNPEVLYAFVDNYEVIREGTDEEEDSYGRPKGGVIRGATVYRTDNGAGHWYQVSGQTEEMARYMERLSSTYGWVFGQIRVDPNDENTIYTMGLELNVSNDAGKTFRPLRGMHVDHHGLWIDPDNSDYLFNANDGGVYVSYDRGLNWHSFTDRLNASQFFNIQVDMDNPFRVYGSIQDHGSYRAVIDLSRGRDRIRPVDFERAPGGEGSNHAIDPYNPNLVYAAGFYGNIYRSNLSDPRETKMIVPKVYENEPRLRGQWMAPFMLSPHNPDILYLGMQYVFRSRDRGDTWERISPDLSHNDPKKSGDIPYQTVFTLSESPLMAGLIYAGTDDGRVHVTRDGGKNWTEISKGLVKDRWISRVVASQHTMGTVYLTQNGKRDDDFAAYVWRSDDYGKTWKPITSNIPLGPANVIREDPVNRDILYLGTDTGVFVSKDGGSSWEVPGNLPTTYVLDLVIHPQENFIVIGTHGRGVWLLDANEVNGGRRSRWGR